MRQKVRDLRNLERISEIGLERELAQLARINKEEDALRSELMMLDGALRKALERRNLESTTSDLFGQKNGAKWLVWRNIQKAKLNAKLAALLAEKEVALSSARLAFGRVQAIQMLAERMVK